MKKVLLALLLVIGVGSAGLFAMDDGDGGAGVVDVDGDVDVEGGAGDVDDVDVPLAADPTGYLAFITESGVYQGVSGELSARPITYSIVGFITALLIANECDLALGNDDETNETIVKISNAFKSMAKKGVFTESAAEDRAILAEEWQTGNWKYVAQVSLKYVVRSVATAAFVVGLAYKFLPLGGVWGRVHGACIGAYAWIAGLLTGPAVPAGALNREAEIAGLQGRAAFAQAEMARHHNVIATLQELFNLYHERVMALRDGEGGPAADEI